MPLFLKRLRGGRGKAMSTGKEKKSDFRLSDFCLSVVTCYILLSTAPRPQARFWYSTFAPLKSELKFGGLRLQRPHKRLPSFFLFSWILLSSLYLVPTYIRYLRRKTVVRNENRPIRWGLIFILNSNRSVELGISEFDTRVDGLSGNQTLSGKTNGKFVNLGVRNSEWHKEPLACGRCLRAAGL